jgi:hypothetical protein
MAEAAKLAKAPTDAYIDPHGSVRRGSVPAPLLWTLLVGYSYANDAAGAYTAANSLSAAGLAQRLSL